MRAEITDARVLAAVRLGDLRLYLATSGWRQVETTAHGAADVWVGGGEDSQEVLVPTNQAFRDYANRVGDVLRAVQLLEGRSQLDIYRDITTARVDVIRVGAKDPSYADGTMPLDEGVAFVGHSRDMVLAAACSAKEPRASFQTRKPTEASEVVGQARLGQTEAGSFVVAIYVPILAPVQVTVPGAEIEEDDPFPRQVTRTLMTGLQGIQDIAVATASRDPMEPFEAAVQMGVSANLCDAVVGIYGATRAQELSVSVKWARSLPILAGAAPPMVVTVHRDAVPVLADLSNLFRRTTAEPGAVIIGYVVQLKRDEGALLGTATVYAAIPGVGMRKVLLPELIPDDYDWIVDAHKRERRVRVTGELRKETRWMVVGERRLFHDDADEDADGAGEG